MIPNHDDFITAIRERRKVRVRFFSVPDQGILDRVCLPLDYGVGGGGVGDLNRYWLWCPEMIEGSRLLGLLSEQILSLRILGDPFAPAEVGAAEWAWSVPRDWSGEPLPFEGADRRANPFLPLQDRTPVGLFDFGSLRFADGSP